MVGTFIIKGEPCGKDRPRFSSRGKYVKTYTPQKTVDYEEFVKWSYLKTCRGKKFEKGVPVGALIVAYYKVPESASKKLKQQMLDKKVFPTKKPDVDNIIKIVLDSCNKSAYYDDAQVVKVVCEKYYSDDPRVEVTLYTIEVEP